MQTQYILSEYLHQAMAQAEYDKLEDNSFSGRIFFWSDSVVQGCYRIWFYFA